jgi:hypothetical protein
MYNGSVERMFCRVRHGRLHERGRTIKIVIDTRDVLTRRERGSQTNPIRQVHQENLSRGAADSRVRCFAD